MIEDSFPTLTASETGWPQLNVDLTYSTSVAITVYEDEEYDVIHIRTIGPRTPHGGRKLRVLLDGLPVLYEGTLPPLTEVTK